MYIHIKNMMHPCGYHVNLKIDPYEIYLEH